MPEPSDWFLEFVYKSKQNSPSYPTTSIQTMEYKQYLTKKTVTLAVVTLVLIIIGASCWSKYFSGSADALPDSKPLVNPDTSASLNLQTPTNVETAQPEVLPPNIKSLFDGDSITAEEFIDYSKRVEIADNEAIVYNQMDVASLSREPKILQVAYQVPYVARILAQEITKIKNFNPALLKECVNETYKKFMPLLKEWAEEGKSALQLANPKLKDKENSEELKKALAQYLIDRADVQMKYDNSLLWSSINWTPRTVGVKRVQEIADSVLPAKK